MLRACVAILHRLRASCLPCHLPNPLQITSLSSTPPPSASTLGSRATRSPPQGPCSAPCACSVSSASSSWDATRQVCRCVPMPTCGAHARASLHAVIGGGTVAVHRAPRAVRRMRTSRRHVGQPGWQSWTPQAGSVREGGRVDAGHWVLSAACMCTDAQGSCPGHVTLPRRPLLSPPHSRQPPSTRTLHTQPPHLCATPTLHTHTQPPAPPHPRPRYSGVLSPTLGRRCSCCSF